MSIPEMDNKETAAWNAWQRYLKRSETERNIVSIGSGIWSGLAIGTAILGYPLALCALPLIVGGGAIIHHKIEKKTNEVWNSDWLTPWRS